MLFMWSVRSVKKETWTKSRFLIFNQLKTHLSNQQAQKVIKLR